ncbi:hypothetical protein LBYZC6_13940 [Lacrimispora brassicae]
MLFTIPACYSRQTYCNKSNLVDKYSYHLSEAYSGKIIYEVNAMKQKMAKVISSLSMLGTVQNIERGFKLC